MAEQINLLFIDDNDISPEINLLRRKLGKMALTLNEIVVSIKDEEFKDENGDLSEAKIKKYFLESCLLDTPFHLVACDFDFADANYNGYELLTWIINESNDKRPKKIIRKAMFTFYTGHAEPLEDIARNDVKKLLRIKVEKIIHRTKLTDELAKLIRKKVVEINLESTFCKALANHSGEVFKSTYPKFRDKTLGYIASEIEAESEHAAGYLDALIEQTIAHMVELQE